MKMNILNQIVLVASSANDSIDLLNGFSAFAFMKPLALTIKNHH